MTNKKPNIVLLFADDLGMGDVSAFNPESKIKTKHIDALAEDGMKFTDSHATSALCTPSRYGLLTGRYNWRSQLKSVVIPGDSLPLIEKDRQTLPLLLKEYDYQTAAIGKWHLGLEWALKDGKDYERYGIERDVYEPQDAVSQKGRPYFGNTTEEPIYRGTDIDYSKPITYGPLQYGFDYFYGTAASLDQGPYVVIENDRALYQPEYAAGDHSITRVGTNTQRSIEAGVMAPEHSVYHLPDQMQAKALEVLDEFMENDEPFLLYYPNHLVHGPILPHERFRGQSGLGDYGDFVLQLDSYVGELVEKLKEGGVYEDTIFIFTSDNGASSIIDIPALQEKGHDPSNGLRGHKMHIWEGGHREPTIVTYPNMIPAGTTSNQMVSHSDFFMTIADILGASVSDDVAEDSHSNLSLWEGKDEPVRQDIVHSAGNGGFSIRRDFWKLILVEDGGLTMQYDREVDNYKKIFRPTELYDLRDDISETNNVIEEYPEIVADLTESLSDYIRRGRSTEGADQANQPDLPTGDWEQIAFMDDYEEYVEELNKKAVEEGRITQEQLDEKPASRPARGI